MTTIFQFYSRQSHLAVLVVLEETSKKEKSSTSLTDCFRSRTDVKIQAVQVIIVTGNPVDFMLTFQLPGLYHYISHGSCLHHITHSATCISV